MPVAFIAHCNGNTTSVKKHKAVPFSAAAAAAAITLDALAPLCAANVCCEGAAKGTRYACSTWLPLCVVTQLMEGVCDCLVKAHTCAFRDDKLRVRILKVCGSMRHENEHTFTKAMQASVTSANRSCTCLRYCRDSGSAWHVRNRPSAFTTHSSSRPSKHFRLHKPTASLRADDKHLQLGQPPVCRSKGDQTPVKVIK